MAKKVFGSFLIMLFSILIFLFFRTGAYKSVATEKIENFTPLRLIYKENIGPFHEIVAKITEVEKALKKLNTDCKKTFGLFLSDPEIIEHSKLESHVGCAFYPGEAPEFFTLPKGIKEKLYGEDLIGKTCYKGSFNGSPSLSALKIYPKLKEMAQDDRIKLRTEALELYYVDGDSVTTEVYLCEE
jgi:effector-binding domain-containing protein